MADTLQKLVDRIFDTVKGLQDRLSARLDALEAREPVAGKDGRDGVDGKDADPAKLKSLEDRLGAAIAEFDRFDHDEFVKAITNAVVSRLPPVKDGADGEVGPQGERGEKGDAGDAGRDGRDGLPGVPGLTGEKGADGINGKDGRDAVMSEIAIKWIDTLNGQFVWKSTGEPVEGGTITFQQPRGMVYRGVWDREETYVTGENVTYGGSLWVCLEPTVGRPGDAQPNGKAWQLAVKKGADGKDGKGITGPQGPKGDKGDPGGRGFN